MVVGLMVASVGTAVASHSGEDTRSDGDESGEHDAYCMLERNGASRDYPGIGWFSNGGEEYLKPDHELLGGDAPVNPRLTVCEGEHWDGEDSVQSGENNAGDCTGQKVDLGNDEYNLAVFQCDDPGRHTDLDLDAPVGVRASGEGDKDALNHGGAYLAIRIGGLGNIHLFAAGCHKLVNGEDSRRVGGAAGSDECQGEHGQGAAGVYLQDNTPFGMNILASVVSAFRITQGMVGEDDCSQSEYEEAAKQSRDGEEPTKCKRDNTAISVELLA